MAKNYTSHAKTRRFERPNFGDMGLRAYKEQQKTIIDGMKLQAAQAKNVRDEYLSGEIDKARKERENRQELKEFEDAVWDNRMLSKEIRADREIEALKQQAKDEEERSKFWLDFSTTYSQQYAKAATDIHDAIDLKSAQKDFSSKRSDGTYNNAITTSSVLNNISSAGIINENDKIYTDKNNSGHYKRTQHAHSLDIEKRRSHNTNNIWAAQLIEDSEKITTHLFRTLRDQNIEITKDNVRGIIEGRALEIMGNLGMNPNSKGGRKFLDHMWDKAGDFELEKNEQNWAAEDNENLYGEKGLIQGLKANKANPVDWEIYFNHTVKHYQSRYVIGEDGKASLQELDVKQAYSATQQLLIEEGVITQEEKHLLNIAHPGQKMTPEMVVDPTKDTRKSMWKRHPDLEDEADKAFLEKEKKRIEDTELNAKVIDAKALAQLKVDIEAKKYDLNNLDDIAKLQEANAKNEKTLKFINEAAVFNPTNNETDGYLVTEKLNKQYKDNDYNAYVNSMQYLGEEDKKRFNKMTRQLDALNANGATASDVKKRMEGHIKDDLGINDISTRANATAGPMAEIMIDDFYYQYRIVANDKKYTSDAARVEAAYEKVLERYDSGRGVYTKKKDTTGTKTVFTAVVGVSDPNTSLESKPTEEVDAKIALGWNNLFEEAKPEKGDFEILDKDYLDRNLRNALLGKSIEPNAMIDKLYITQPQGAKMLSKTEIFNKYLESKGISTRVPAGPLDHAEFTALNTQININNFNKLSDEDKMRMQTYLETGVMPTAKPKDVQNLEKNDAIRQNFSPESQYSKREVKDMNKNNRPWWYNPALFGDHYYKNK